MRRLLFFTLFLLLCFASALYVIGNERNFTVKTQFFLLNMILYVGMFLAVCVMLDFIFNAGFALLKQKKHIPSKSFVFLLLGLVAFILSGLAATILVLTTRNIA
ncbi:MAG: hypothetical protein LBD44_04820 [Spirochaetaceae bacterium]|jgi:hypothetical protein|nr:hypothetical protein [Spirochaetaceae bacterium]